jgi:hypothetical protein
MDAGIGAAIVAAAIIAIFVVPLISMIIRQSAKKVGEAALDAIKPSADAPLYLVKATDKARDIFHNHASIFLSYTASTWEELDEQVRSGTEQQLMMLAFTSSLLNISIQDVAYDEGAVDTVALLQGKGGFPKLKISDAAFEHALHTIWQPLTDQTKKLLGAQYRRFFATRTSVGGRDASLFTAMSEFATRKLTDEFSYRMQPKTDWLDYIRGISIGDAAEARQILRY